MLNSPVIYVLPFFIGAVAEPVALNTNTNVVSGLIMWHNSTHCSGDEKQLIDCPAMLEHQFQKCSSTKYAGVKCESLKGNIPNLYLPCYYIVIWVMFLESLLIFIPGLIA